MMPTSDERREVAERLREHDGNAYADVADMCDEDLADLIDPTCFAVHQGTSMDDELVCSRCGASLGAEVGGRQMFVPNFCSCCGARVVSRDEQ